MGIFLCNESISLPNNFKVQYPVLIEHTYNYIRWWNVCTWHTMAVLDSRAHLTSLPFEKSWSSKGTVGGKLPLYGTIQLSVMSDRCKIMGCLHALTHSPHPWGDHVNTPCTPHPHVSHWWGGSLQLHLPASCWVHAPTPASSPPKPAQPIAACRFGSTCSWQKALGIGRHTDRLNPLLY